MICITLGAPLPAPIVTKSEEFNIEGTYAVWYF
jgi:hypothetical protein